MSKKSRSSISSASVANKVGFPSSKASTTAPKKKVSSAVSKALAPVAPPTADELFNAHSNEWDSLHKAAKKRMGPPVHGENLTPVDIILSVFDASEEYGPASNLTRLERFERATRLGLDPPEQLGMLLKVAPPRYQRSGFNGEQARNDDRRCD
ncbi:DNA polymerase delta subunit 4, partial [Phenoliferia sp. Uapishka_3]